MNQKIQTYLSFYNLISLIAWLSLSIYILSIQFMSNVYAVYGLAIIQSLAVLEIFHAYKKWVKTDAKLAFLQIFARLFIIALIYILWIKNTIILWLGITTFVWSLAEITRYGFYYFSHDKLSKLFSFLRYNAFIVLYPTGVFLEFFIGYHWLKMRDFKLDVLTIVVGLIFISYFYYFPILYKYMWRQREKWKIGTTTKKV